MANAIGNDLSQFAPIGNNSVGGGKLMCVSALRFCAMSMIVACHICQFYDNGWAWWLNVGVQIFFILSGFLYGFKTIVNPINWLLKNCYKILLPYYIFLVIALALYLIFFPNLLNPISIIKAFLCVGTIKGLGHLWFVGYIVFCYFLTPILQTIAQYIKDRGFWFSLCSISILIAVFYTFTIVTNFYFTAYNVICYIIGYFIATFVKRYGVRILKYVVMISIPMAIISKVAYLYIESNMPNISGMNHVLGLSHLTLGLALTYTLLLLFKSVKDCKLLQFSDRYSYHIYLVHLLFILSPFTLMSVTKYAIVNIVFVLIAVMISGVLLYKVSQMIDTIICKYLIKNRL